jgi:Arc/MetJ family transcription regulator
MATVNFSVPDDVKAEFDKAFGDQNKSSIIADLMRRAVREHQLQIRRSRVFRQLSNARASRPSLSSEEIRKARAADRS